MAGRGILDLIRSGADNAPDWLRDQLSNVDWRTATVDALSNALPYPLDEAARQVPQQLSDVEEFNQLAKENPDLPELSQPYDDSPYIPRAITRLIYPGAVEPEIVKAQAVANEARAKVDAIRAKQEAEQDAAVPDELAQLISDSKRMGGKSGAADASDIFVASEPQERVTGSDYARGDGSDASESRGGNFSHSSGKGFIPRDDLAASGFTAAGIPPEVSLILSSLYRRSPDKALELAVGQAKNKRQEAARIIGGAAKSRDTVMALASIKAQLKAEGYPDSFIDIISKYFEKPKA